jgi:hypothetical protein
MNLSADAIVQRLRQQIDFDVEPEKLRDVVLRLNIALHETRERPPAKLATRAREEKNPFDAVLL